MVGLSPVRVLRVISRLNIGGPAVHTTLLTTRLDPTRYDSTLVTGTEEEGEGNYLELQGLSVPRLVRLPGLGREIRGLAEITVLRKLMAVIRRVRPHVVHTHAAKAGALGRVAARLCRVPVVVHTYHGHVLRGYFSPLKTSVFLRIERMLAHATDELVAVSPRVREELLHMGIGHPARFSVVPLGLDLDTFVMADRLRGSLRAELGLGARVPLVGIVARLAPIKAHEVFLAAAREVLAEVPGTVFLLVGDGPRRAGLERLAGEMGLGPNARFLGWRGDLPRVYADLDVVALSSRNEGSPVALIEAMAAGRPVAATRVGGVPDVVVDGENGRLVPPDEPVALARAVVDLLSAPDQRTRLGAAGRASVVARYGAQRLVDDIDTLYQRLLASRLG